LPLVEVANIHEVAIQRLDQSIQHVQESSLPTLEAIAEEKRQRRAQEEAEKKKKYLAAQSALAADEQTGETTDEEKSLGGLEDEADQQGAFNPETGEINWDCPCLGGMAHGPCGEEFKAAFSCFVYSNEEPKGVECIEKFK
jgi:intermembrane space import and assembly protein 40